MKKDSFYPKNLLRPVGAFLVQRLNDLKQKKQALSKEDPYKDTERLNSNASPDDDAYEQTGHLRVTALKREIDRKIIQVRKALTRVKVGRYGFCESCGKMIDTDRLIIYPEATLCVDCQKQRE